MPERPGRFTEVIDMLTSIEKDDSGKKSKTEKRDVLDQGSATFSAQRTGLSRKTFRGPALKININIQQLNFISAYKISEQ